MRARRLLGLEPVSGDTSPQVTGGVNMSQDGGIAVDVNSGVVASVQKDEAIPVPMLLEKKVQFNPAPAQGVEELSTATLGAPHVSWNRPASGFGQIQQNKPKNPEIRNNTVGPFHTIESKVSAKAGTINHVAIAVDDDNDDDDEPLPEINMESSDED